MQRQQLPYSNNAESWLVRPGLRTGTIKTRRATD
jgi:hypothetical protein